jgi:hypothetical protein
MIGAWNELTFLREQVRTALLSDTESLTGKYEERFPEVLLAAASLH